MLLDLYTVRELSGIISLKTDFTHVLESFLKYDSQLVEQGDEGALTDSTVSSCSKRDFIENITSECADWVKRDPWQHVSSILCNITRLEDGRRILLRQSSQYMGMLIKQIRSRNPIRRRGAVASLRTCLFDNEIHWWIVHEVRVLPFIMLPIIVATPFTDMEKNGMDPILWLNAENPAKKWESEVDILMMLLECIILLCQKRGIREELRKRQVYPMCRNLDYLQEDGGVSSLILEIVNLLMRDEDPDTPMEVDNSLITEKSVPMRIVETSTISNCSATLTDNMNEQPKDSCEFLDLVD